MDEKENKRYIKNSDTARKVLKSFGYILHSFEPNWRFMKTWISNTFSMPDNMMAQLALQLKLPWKYQYPKSKLMNEIINSEKQIKSCNEQLKYKGIPKDFKVHLKRIIIFKEEYIKELEKELEER